MEQTDSRPEAQEQPIDPELQPWVTPAFERVPLNEALSGFRGPKVDGGGYTYTYS
jgi:hypothetical protein